MLFNVIQGTSHDNPTSGVGNYTETRAYCATDQRRYANAEEDSDMEEELKEIT